MKTGLVILAACASSLAFAQIDAARACYGVALEPANLVSIAHDGPAHFIVAFKSTTNESPRPTDRQTKKANNGGGPKGPSAKKCGRAGVSGFSAMGFHTC